MPVAVACRTYRWVESRREDVEKAIRSSRTRDEAAEKLGTTRDGLSHAGRVYGFVVGAMLGTALRVAPAAPPPVPAVLSAPVVVQGAAEPGKDTLITGLFDAHAPEEDRPGFSAWLRWTQDERPDEIILSELAEWLSCSQHNGGSWGSSWDRDKADVRRRLIQIRSVNPHARIVWQESNHDTRLTRILEQRLPSFAGSMTIANELGLAELGVEWVGERVALRRGSAKIIHGHQLATNERSGMLPKYHAARAVQLYGEPGVTVVYGHVHREQVYTEACEGGMKRARSIGCMRTLRPAWHRATEMGHHLQFAALYVSAGGGTSLYAVDVTGGAFNFSGRRYAA